MFDSRHAPSFRHRAEPLESRRLLASTLVPLTATPTDLVYDPVRDCLYVSASSLYQIAGSNNALTRLSLSGYGRFDASNSRA